MNDVLNPVEIEDRVQNAANQIARGVRIATDAELEARAARRAFDLAFAHANLNAIGSIPDRKYKAQIETMHLREAAEIAESALAHAERTTRALEKELFAFQSIGNWVKALYGAVRA